MYWMSPVVCQILSESCLLQGEDWCCSAARWVMSRHCQVMLQGIKAWSKAMGWLRLVGSLKSKVSFVEYSLFYRALLQKWPMILWSLLIVATPYQTVSYEVIKAPSTNHTEWVSGTISHVLYWWRMSRMEQGISYTEWVLSFAGRRRAFWRGEMSHVLYW